jgi:hypothetical protein
VALCLVKKLDFALKWMFHLLLLFGGAPVAYLDNRHERSKGIVTASIWIGKRIRHIGNCLVDDNCLYSNIDLTIRWVTCR